MEKEKVLKRDKTTRGKPKKSDCAFTLVRDTTEGKMGKVLQKKKNRSSNPRVKHKSKKAKNGNKKINVFGNAIIKSNWDKKLTLTQNYRRLGLTSRLNAPAGGVEKKISKGESDTTRSGLSEPFHVPLTQKRSKKLQPAEVRVERDPETGKILRVISGDNEEDETIEVAGRKRRRNNPLNDPLEDLPEDTDMALGDLNGTSSFDVVTELEKQAAAQEEQLKNRKPRHQSKREEEWLERLVQKYSDDTARMAKDRKLNPMQQTEADIARRLRKMRARNENE